MAKKIIPDQLQQLPACAADFIKQVIHKMHYRRKIRKDVQAELEAHFEDGLRDCINDAEKEQKAQQLITNFGDVKLLAVLLRRAKKRCRPLWQKALLRTAQVIGIIFLYLIISTSPLLIGKPTIKVDYVQWLNEKYKAGRDETDNARPYYDKAVELCQKMPYWLAESTADWPADFNDAQLNSFTEWLTSNKEAFATFRKAVEYPYYWRSYQNTQDINNASTDLTQDIMPDIMEPLSDYKQLANAIRWQIRYEAYRGDVEQAMQDCLSLVKFGDNMHGNGLLVEELVGISIEAIGLHECSLILGKVNVQTTILKNMQERLNNSYKKDKPVISFDSEKVFWYDIIQRGFTDNGKGDGRLLKRGLPYVIGPNPDWLKKVFLFDYPSRKEALATIEQFFAKSDTLMAKTPCQLQNEGIDANNWSDDIPNKSFMLALEGPSFYAAGKVGWRLKTDRQALLTELALLQYKNEKGQFPDELNQLVSAGYLKQLPQDPYSDKPLVYKKNGSEFILYSVGSNFIDDGGQMGTDSSGRKMMYRDNGDWVYWPIK